MQAGEKAAQAPLQSYIGHGNNTIRKIVSRWAPSSENDTAAYINSVSRTTGIAPDSKIGNGQIPLIAQAMYQQENGAKWASQYAQNMPKGAAAGRWHIGNSMAGNTSITTTIGQITVHTQATDAPGIARSLGPAIKGGADLLATQGNTGLN
ncbi:MAG: hypothetical protein B7X10_03275 [Burkholderiales bacterium 21-58-4]|nr:MAG: hypothetical protein B7X10_03275 [Burkholderiales bacterium 21-58-4]